MKIIYKIFIVLLIFSSVSCTGDFLDVNKDPNNPVEASLPLLLTSAQVSMSDALSLGSGGFGEIAHVYVHQHSTRESFDRYGVAGSDYEIETAWETIYSIALQDLEIIIKNGTANGDFKYVGIAQVLKAYIYSQLVDLFGDVPYTEACRFEEIKYPKYDDDEFIYDEVLKLLDEAIINLGDTESLNEPDSDDLIFGGDLNLWKKTAKSIKLKLYSQLRLVRDVTSDVSALIAENDLITAGNEFELKYGTSESPDNRHPGFRGGEYTGGQESYYISPWFYETMKGMATDWHPRNPFENIPDPRVPYYFYRQSSDGSGDSPVEYEHENFISIYFGSNGVNRDGGQQTKGTKPGIFPIGGRYDENDARRVDKNSGPADVPSRFLTHASLLFIQAELALVGVIDADDAALYEQAVTAAFAKVDAVVDNSSTTQDVPSLIGSDAFETYLERVVEKYNNATDEEKLEYIITQKWIASYGSAIDCYTDYRRTGYPVLHDPEIDGIDYTSLSGRRFPLSLPWSQDDLEKNTSAPIQKIPADTPVFWDVDK